MSLRAHCRSIFAIVSLAIATASQAVAGPYTGLYIFGDSLSDSGNIAATGNIDVGQVITGNSYTPNKAYSSGTFSNGPVWSTQFATMLGLSAAPSLAGGGDFAFGGARTSTSPTGSPSLTTQLGMYFTATGNTAQSSALYVIAGGGNNARDALDAIGGGANVASTIASTATNYANDVAGMVAALKLAGAQHIIVWNTPNIGVTPGLTAANAVNPAASLLASSTATAMNNALTSALAGQAGVTIFDTYGFLTNTVMNVIGTPGGYNGITNALMACGAVAVGNCGSSLFWDSIHPTTYAHSLLAQQMFSVAVPVPEPAEYALMLLGLAVVAGAARRRARA